MVLYYAAEVGNPGTHKELLAQTLNPLRDRCDYRVNAPNLDQQGLSTMSTRQMVFETRPALEYELQNKNLSLHSHVYASRKQNLTRSHFKRHGDISNRIRAFSSRFCPVLYRFRSCSQDVYTSHDSAKRQTREHNYPGAYGSTHTVL